MIDEM